MNADIQSYETKSPRGTLALGKRLGARLGIGDCVALTGDLGAGKTALVRGIAEGLGLQDRRMVSSPTYVLVQQYPCRVPVFHVDLYRLSAPEAEFDGLGIGEMLSQGVVLIEWAERAVAALPRPRWEIRIEVAGPKQRRFDVRRVE